MQITDDLDDDQTGWPIDPSPWAWLRWILGQVLRDYPAHFERGLTRMDAAILARSLWSIEAVLRRLLLAAAFALNIVPRPPRPTARAGGPEPPQASPKEKRTRSFCVFAIHRRLQAGSGAQPHAIGVSVSPTYSTFLPADPLLTIGAERRPSRGHTFRYLDTHDPYDDRIRRPAPALAGRLDSVLRIFRDPQAATRRLALLLARRAGIAQSFADVGPPWWTGHERFDRPPGLDEMEIAHASLEAALGRPALDTS